MSNVHSELAEILLRKESGVFGGYSRTKYVHEVCTYIIKRYSDPRGYFAKREDKKSVKKLKLSSFDNYTSTTAINRCLVLVVVPNIGMIKEIITRICYNSRTESLRTRYDFFGDPEDSFFIGLRYSSENGFEESSISGATLVIATPTGIVTMGDEKIDRSKYHIKSEEELKSFERTVKIEMGIYSFLSSVDTAIFLDTDLLELQSIISLEELILILKEAQPSKPKQMDLKYLSSGEEKKSFVFLSTVITSGILHLAQKYTSSEGYALRTATPKKRIAPRYPITVYQKKPSISFSALALYYINALLSTQDKTLIVLKDSIQVAKVMEEVNNSSITGTTGVLFIDEHTSKTLIKEELQKENKFIWVITERFIFYRRKRLSRLISPFDPKKIISPFVINPEILSILLEHTNPLSSDSPLFFSPILVTFSEDDQPAINYLLGAEFNAQTEFQYSDYTTIPAIE
ncbi:hypothetical protein NEOKW01_1761 [Nematocida sp. AWRm80]|nr:hypothetical protein NEOKW01_1761 [Nematocida sp. AWRm80]